MTFTIQFLFRKAQSFNVGAGLGSNLCLNWYSFVKQCFEGESTFWCGFPPTPTAFRAVMYILRVFVLLWHFRASNPDLEKDCWPCNLEDHFVCQGDMGRLCGFVLYGPLRSLTKSRAKATLEVWNAQESTTAMGGNYGIAVDFLGEKYAAPLNIDPDGRRSLTFPSLTSLRFPVQPEGEGLLGESCGLLACSLRPV